MPYLRKNISLNLKLCGGFCSQYFVIFLCEIYQKLKKKSPKKSLFYSGAQVIKFISGSEHMPYMKLPFHYT